MDSRFDCSDKDLSATISAIIQNARELSPEATACHRTLLRFCQPGELITAMPLEFRRRVMALCEKLVCEYETITDDSETASEAWTSESSDCPGVESDTDDDNATPAAFSSRPLPSPFPLHSRHSRQSECFAKRKLAVLGSITARLILPADVDKDSSLTAGTFKCTHEKHYKLTVAKGSAHMLRALRVREMNGGGDSAQVRRILRAQGRLPEVKGSQGPQGFSRWDDAVNEWLKDSDDEGADEAQGLPRQDSTDFDDVPDLVEMTELGHDDHDKEMARVPCGGVVYTVEYEDDLTGQR